MCTNNSDIYKSCLKKHPINKKVKFLNCWKIEDIFELSYANILEIINNDENEQFLLLERQKGRSSCILETGNKLALKKKSQVKKLKK